MARHPIALLALLLAASACAPDGVADDTGADGANGPGEGDGLNEGAAGPGTTTPDLATAVLEIHPLDIWAQPLPQDEGRLRVTVDGSELQLDGYAPARIYLDGPGSYRIELSAPEFEDLVVEVDFDGTASLGGVRVRTATEGHGASLAHDVRKLEDREVPFHAIHLGLRHRWFSAEGRPARRGNEIDVYLDGEAAWKAVHGDLVAAQDEVLAATWFWESDFELIRNPATHIDLTPNERWKNTMLGVLESNPAIIRVLVGQFWGQDGILSGVTVDDDLLYYAELPNDGIEYMGQANETEGVFFFEVPPFRFSDRIGGASFDDEPLIESTVPARQVDLTEWPIDVQVQAASYHQKFAVVDHEVAYVGGMNVKATDWDTSDHYVFEWYRMPFEATVAEREAVYFGEALPATGPRKDYMVRVEGPAAQDVADIFHRRWQEQRANGVEYAENTSDFDVKRSIAPRAGGKHVQITATLPEPFWEHAIAETWFNAVANAERFILIEDQYFRIPMLNAAIVKRMEQVPDLRLVVITKPVSEWTDPGCAQTHIAHQLFKSAFPDRYLSLQLRSFATQVTWGIDETDAHFVDIDVHSKMLIVDDLFMSVGSANKNNRGIVYEGELNVAVVDAPEVTSVRRRMLANMMPGWPQTDDPELWWSDLVTWSEYNDWIHANWEYEGGDLDLDGAPLPDAFIPYGYVYSLDFNNLSDCLFESVGPDMTGAELP